MKQQILVLNRSFFAIALLAATAFTTGAAPAQAQQQNKVQSSQQATSQPSPKIIPTSESPNNYDQAGPKSPQIAPSSAAQPAVPATEVTPPKDFRTEPAEKQSEMKSRINRGTHNWQIHAIYSPLDLLIPQKIGASATYIKSASQSFEIEYLRGKISAPSFIDDIGSMTDTKISILGRSYFSRNSFNVSYGITYFKFNIHLGNEYLQSISPNQRANFDLITMESVGLNIGVGNRWAITDHISWGIDWIELYQPLVETKNENGFVDETTDPDDKKDVEDALDIVAHFPRLTVLKLSIGATF